MKVTLLAIFISLFVCGEVIASEVKGVVKNQNGEPLEKVLTFCGRSVKGIGGTDAKGEFTVKGECKVVFFRAVGYEPFSKVLDGSTIPIEIRLQKTPEPKTDLPSCALSLPKEKRVGAFIKLSVPKGANSNDGSDIDYEAFAISKKFGKRKVWVTGINGATASFGVPREELILNSTQFTEKSFKGISNFVDLSGQAKDGTFWRYIGAFGEEIRYENLTEQESKYFDQIIDNACSEPKPTMKQ